LSDPSGGKRQSKRGTQKRNAKANNPARVE
jgi:hypothetical protein